MLAVAIALALIAAAIYFRPNRAPSGDGSAEQAFGLGFTGFKGSRQMARRVHDPVPVTDAEYVTIGLNPEVKTDGGVPIPAEDFDWSTSDAAIGDVQATYTTRDGQLVDPGPYGRVIVTPGGQGTVEITVTHRPSGDQEVQPLVVGASAPGDFGMSVGTPARD